MAKVYIETITGALVDINKIVYLTAEPFGYPTAGWVLVGVVAPFKLDEYGEPPKTRFAGVYGDLSAAKDAIRGIHEGLS